MESPPSTPVPGDSSRAAPEPVAHTSSLDTSAPVSPEIGSSSVAPETWRPAPTLGDRLSPPLRSFFRRLGLALALGAALCVLLWLVPTWLVSRRPGFLALRAAAEGDRGLRQVIGEPVVVARLPTRFELGETEERYTLLVHGPLATARVRGRVRAGQVSSLEVDLAPRSERAWAERHPDRPLRPRRPPTLGPRPGRARSPR